MVFPQLRKNPFDQAEYHFGISRSDGGRWGNQKLDDYRLTRHATTELVARYYEVSVDTIDSMVEDNGEELENNGYRSLKGPDLREFAASIANVTNFISPKARSLAIYSRRAILNVGMLLRDSPIAQRVRAHLLDVEEAGQCLTVGAGLRECDEGSSQAVAIPDPGGAHAATFPGDRP
jgi:hypothetical protein